MPLPRALQKIDLQLLSCFDALIAERSVTRAAERLEMSQPAMSSALAKLREALQDPLLVRTPRGMVATPRGAELAEVVRYHLRALEAAFVENEPFDSRTAKGRIRVATTDYAGMLLFPRVIERLRAEAPGLSLLIRLPDPNHIREWLEEGECEIAVGFFPGLSERLRMSVLFNDTVSCIAKRPHPAIRGQLTLRQYMDASHVIFGSPFDPISTLDTWVNQALAELGLQRKSSMQVPSIALPAYIVAQTDLLATLPTWLSQHFASRLPLQILKLPFPIAELPFSLVWHDRTHRIGAQQWVRQVIREVSDSVRGAIAAEQSSGS